MNLRIVSLLCVTLRMIMTLTLAQRKGSSNSLLLSGFRGIVKNVRKNPLGFISGLFFKKAIFLLKLKITWAAAKKLLLKKIFLKRIIRHYATDKLFPKRQAFGRRKRNVRFPSEEYTDHEIGDPLSTISTQESIVPFRSQVAKMLNEELLVNLREDSNNPNEGKVSAIFSDLEIGQTLAMANDLDDASCIPKAVCLIMAKGNENFPHGLVAKAITSYYQDRQRTVENGFRTREFPISVYDEAAELGKIWRSEQACTTHYRECPWQENDIMKMLNQAFQSNLCVP